MPLGVDGSEADAEILRVNVNDDEAEIEWDDVEVPVAESEIAGDVDEAGDIDMVNDALDVRLGHCVAVKLGVALVVRLDEDDVDLLAIADVEEETSLVAVAGADALAITDLLAGGLNVRAGVHEPVGEADLVGEAEMVGDADAVSEACMESDNEAVGEVDAPCVRVGLGEALLAGLRVVLTDLLTVALTVELSVALADKLAYAEAVALAVDVLVDEPVAVLVPVALAVAVAVALICAAGQESATLCAYPPILTSHAKPSA